MASSPAVLLAADPLQVSVAPGLLGLLPLVLLWLWCLVDVVQTDERLVRFFTKEQWIFMVLLTSVVGGLLWLIFGRPRQAR